jgi:predicted ATP-grasp superfamily ATP-dependent carboligase
MLQRAGYRGMFSAEFKLDPRDGVFKLIEVNARAWWYVDFAARCGADVCRLAYADALAEPLEAQSAYAVGKRLVYPYYDFFGCSEMRQRGEVSLIPSMLSWLGAMQPVFQFEDPWPGLRALAGSMRSFVGKRLRKNTLSRG